VHDALGRLPARVGIFGETPLHDVIEKGGDTGCTAEIEGGFAWSSALI